MQRLHSNILLLEEEPTLMQITAFRLELLGHVVHAVDSAAQGLKWLETNEPGLIAVGQVSDVDPVELLNRISDDTRTSDVPLVFMSANSDLSEVQRAFNAGADEYLVTPYDPLVLERKVEGLLAVSASVKRK
ncbi:MAG: response regulator [Pirellulales bacterium]|nr:response regulator [Pirellulales bacterium]